MENEPNFKNNLILDRVVEKSGVTKSARCFNGNPKY